MSIIILRLPIILLRQKLPPKVPLLLNLNCPRQNERVDLIPSRPPSVLLLCLLETLWRFACASHWSYPHSAALLGFKLPDTVKRVIFSTTQALFSLWTTNLLWQMPNLSINLDPIFSFSVSSQERNWSQCGDKQPTLLSNNLPLRSIHPRWLVQS